MSLPVLADILDGRGFSTLEQLERTPLVAIEHGYVTLPPEMIRQDGTLDFYPEVATYFIPTYHNNKPIIRCSGLVGHIPLNDRYALEVGTRVPVGNLERLIAIAQGQPPTIIKFNRQFGQTEERPESFFEILADKILDAFEHVWEFGLVKTYVRAERTGTNPAGRILPFKSEWKSSKLGRTVAVSSAFVRTADFGPNRVLYFAFEKLLVHYVGIRQDRHRNRIKRLRNALHRLEDVTRPSQAEVSPAAIARYVRDLPSMHEHYADALMAAQLIIYDAGIAVRGTGKVAILPSILIDMAKVFENYIRRVLADGLSDDGRFAVKDGNIGGQSGARAQLFEDVLAGIENPRVTPDIVIEMEGKPVLVIDAKYKPIPRVPDRNDINQVVLYGAKYDTKQVMVLHSERPAERRSIERCGVVGTYSIYLGMVNLGAADIAAEEKAFVAAVRELL